jgi:nucleoside phosphorylase
MGGIATANAAAPLVHEYRPRCLAMCGVCAGQRGKTALGDVIIADRLWTYDTGSTVLERDDATGQDVARFKADPFQYQLSAVWRQRAESFRPDKGAQWLTQRPRSHEDQANWLLARLAAGESPTGDERELYCRDYPEIVRSLWKDHLLEDGEVRLSQAGRKHVDTLRAQYPDGLPEPAPFKVHVGPIGTGTALVRDDAIFDKLSERMRKILGLEMEAAAIGAIAALHDVGRMIVMKGVMDFADRKKSDNFKAFAARASAECLVAFLRDNLAPANPRVWITPNGAC